MEMEKPNRLEIWDEAKLRLMFSNGPLLVNTEDNHYKFWHYDRFEKRVYWGRIGSKIKSQDVSDKSGSYEYTKIREKLRKGYRELD